MNGKILPKGTHLKVQVRDRYTIVPGRHPATFDGYSVFDSSKETPELIAVFRKESDAKSFKMMKDYAPVCVRRS